MDTDLGPTIQAKCLDLFLSLKKENHQRQIIPVTSVLPGQFPAGLQSRGEKWNLLPSEAGLVLPSTLANL